VIVTVPALAMIDRYRNRRHSNTQRIQMRLKKNTRKPAKARKATTSFECR
jgi:hypothetical protein